MTPAERWARVDAILQAALDLSGEERARLLARECSGDDALCRDVLDLLEADGRAEAFLGGSTEPAASVGVRPAGERIGPYRLERLLGQGGMSAVYLAARADGAFERRVALKVMEHGGFNADWRRRFHVERRILARLEHPLIARLLDGGTTGDGCPYLVMELVEGRPIDRYCRDEGLSVRERVELLQKVCEAVAWAHRNLIVHRDLKPGNVLVTGDGEVRLLDFGIAKLLEPAAFGVSAEETRSQLRLMSPAYASPEQIAGGAVTTATDVWALGMLAYEVLCGSRPFGAASSLAELEASRRQGPELPSRCASAADARPRGTLRRQLRGDLDTIVLKALRLEPERRYGTAEELRADLERHLRGQPVAARADTLVYRVGKLLRRHRLLAATVAASLVVIVSLAVGLARQAARLRAERDKAREAMSLLAHLFGEAAGKRGETLTVREALQSGEPRIRRDLAGQPQLLGVLLTALGSVYHDLGLYAEARLRLEEALRLLTPAGEPHELHSTLLNLAILEQSVGSFDRAEALYRQALEVARREHGAAHPEAANVLAHLGALAFFRDRPQEAEEPLLAAIVVLDGETASQYAETNAFAHSSLGGVYRKLGRLDQAERSLRRALDIANRRKIHPYLFILYNDLALIESDRGDLPTAVETFGRALAGLEAEVGAEHPFTAKVRTNLCRARRRLGDPAGASALCRQALADFLAAFGPDHPETRYAQTELSQAVRDLESRQP